MLSGAVAAVQPAAAGRAAASHSSQQQPGRRSGSEAAHSAPVCAATSFFRSPIVSSSLHLTRICESAAGGGRAGRPLPACWCWSQPALSHPFTRAASIAMAGCFSNPLTFLPSRSFSTTSIMAARTADRSPSSEAAQRLGASVVHSEGQLPAAVWRDGPQHDCGRECAGERDRLS